MKLSDFKLTASDFGTFGHDLQRPECVWIDLDGIWTSDMRGGIAHVVNDKESKVLGTGIGEPNGFSRRPDGSFVVAGIGDGGLYLITPDGKTRTLTNNFEGKPLGAVNYACADGPDRIWLSVMTRALPWHAALTTTKIDGYILRVDDNGARCEIVADGLDLTNEVKVSPDGRYLYSVETFGSRIVRFEKRADGSLGPKEVFGPQSLGRDVLPDGITFDRFGNLWITIINQNGLTVLNRRGDPHIIFQDTNEEAVKIMTAGIEQRTGVVDHMAACAQGPIPLATSIAFGGLDGRTAYVGSVAQSHLATFRLPETFE
jgi:sugar lactone lactonase YvrE